MLTHQLTNLGSQVVLIQTDSGPIALGRERMVVKALSAHMKSLANKGMIEIKTITPPPVPASRPRPDAPAQAADDKTETAADKPATKIKTTK